MSTTQLIANRVRKGANATESADLLDQIVSRHDGVNLASALVYEGFATERQALAFAGVTA